MVLRSLEMSMLNLKLGPEGLMTNAIARRLELYTQKCPQEVLIIRAEIDGERDEIAIFKGFSSSLMRPTATNPDIPVLPDSAKIITIDRVASPYNPNDPQYIQQGLTWDTIQSLLAKVGV